MDNPDQEQPQAASIAIKRRKVGLLTCTALVVGNMIGSGVFLLPAAMARYGGISIIGWIVSGLGALMLALVFAGFSRTHPSVGGPYAFARLGFGDFVGFLIGWGYWISMVAGNAAIAVAMVSYATVFAPGLAGSPAIGGVAAVAAVWVLTLVNIRGVSTAGSVQLVTTVMKVLPLLLIALAGFWHFEPAHYEPFNTSGESTLAAITGTAALALWAFQGFESASVPADDIDQPAKTIPRATILGFLLATTVYIISTVSLMGMIEPAALQHSTAPFADAAQLLWGQWAYYAVGGVAVISCFGALNGWILSSGQVPFAAARDGAFPEAFAQQNSRGAPVFALVISAVLVSFLIFTNYTRGLVGMFTFVILLSTLSAVIPFAFTCIAQLMVMIRERDSLGKAVRPLAVLIASAGFIFAVWAIAGTGRDSVYWGFLLLLAGMPVYVFILWQRRNA